MPEQLNSTLGTFTPDNLIAGNDVPLLLKGVTVLTGQGVLVRGSVVGIVTASGKAKLVDNAAVDGSQTAKYILANTVDTTAADVVTEAYLSGLFNRQALIFGGDDTAADHEDTLRQNGIFLKDNIAY